MENNVKFHDYLVLGAGPSGLQIGYFFKKNNLDYKILESGASAGSTFKKFPRHRQLISINKVYTGFDDPEINLRWDWNSLLNDENFLFSDFDKDYFPNADSMVKYLGEFAKKFELDIDFNTDVSHIRRESPEGRFLLTTNDGKTYAGNKLIVATGFRKENSPNIPGLELTEPYATASVNPQDYVNQNVLIVGKGNSAFEAADNLTPTAAIIHIISPEVLQFAWKTHYVGDLRAVNNNFLDTYQLKSQNAILDAFIEKITVVDGKYHVDVSYLHADGEREVLIYDRIINCTGFAFDNTIFDADVKPNLCRMSKYPQQTAEWESTNVKDMYFAGTITHVRDYRKTTSGFIHGFRYNVRALFKILKSKYEDQAIPSTEIGSDIDSLINFSMARINRSSALWQQFGFLIDAIDLTASEEKAKYYEELPIEYIHDEFLKDCKHYMTISLEFGKVTGDPFAIDRKPTPEKADESVFLHPVFRIFRDGRLVTEYHLLENLYGEWKDKELHIQPLKNHLEKHFATETESLFNV